MTTRRARTDHAIVHCSHTPHNRRSAVTFGDTHALVPLSVMLGGLSSRTDKRLTAALLTGQFIDVHSSSQPDWSELRALTLRLVHKSRHILQMVDARIRYVFNCGNIADSVNQFLDGFEPMIDTNTKGKQQVHFGLEQCALSAFVLLEVGENKAMTTSSLTDTIETLISKDGTTQSIHFRTVQRLDRVATVTTPFSNEVFFRSINVGSVANVFGHNSCLFVASQALVSGCDGGAVYNERLELAGIIVSTTFRWKQSENASMTLVASFAEILQEFLRQSALCGNVQIVRNAVDVGRTQLPKCVLLIEVGASSGTGTFIMVNGRRFILTCSHVVANLKTSTATATCTWSGGTFQSRVLYRNPKHARAYDVALLEAPDRAIVADHHFITCAHLPAAVGQRIYATGFPHFFALAKQQFAPSVLEGRITKAAAHILFTDASIQAGQSGGPLLNVNGEIAGVMVSNTRESMNGQIHPNVNMCIPIGAIWRIIEEYAASDDIRVLDRLEASDEVARSWSLQPDHVPSKL